jgi:hypothetical protein
MWNIGAKYMQKYKVENENSRDHKAIFLEVSESKAFH